MDEASIQKKIKELEKQLPKFPDGRINYTTSNIAPVINVCVSCKGKILLLKRSDKVLNYKGMWNVIGGYIDRPEPLQAKAMSELNEETGIDAGLASSIVAAEPYMLIDKKTSKTWLVCAFLVEFDKAPKVKLDFEHTEYRWIAPEELKSFDTVPGIENTYRLLTNQKQKQNL
jgi:8-oxo-dGTP pyrophosphatase MutT (NUDIX family)